MRLFPKRAFFTSAAIVLALLAPVAGAASWDAMQQSPATIEVANMKPVPLAESEGKEAWTKVPEQLKKRGAMVFMPAAPVNGIADFKVLADGYVLVACNYDYQGNRQGKWDEEDWDERKFRSKGWDKLTNGELGGPLVKGGNREQVVFAKQLKKGTTARLRCNKYDPPFLIILTKPATR